MSRSDLLEATSCGLGMGIHKLAGPKPSRPERSEPRSLPRKTPATVVTGFLGAGKTSLVRHLLEAARGRRIALIVNEFGDRGVDRDLLAGCGIEGCAEDDLVELANGCICCTVADDFLPTMRLFLERAEPPDHIIIETSGLALPKPLVQAFGWPDVRTRATVDGVVAVIDAAATAAGLFAGDPAAPRAAREADNALDHASPLEELFEEQVQCADLVVLNKVDQVDGSALERAMDKVRAHLRPGAHLLQAVHGRLDPLVLLGLEAAAEDDLESRPSHHDEVGEHHHDDFSSVVVELGEVAAPEPVEAAIHAVVRAHEVYRIKGFLAVRGKAMRLVVQAVGDRLQRYFDRPWRAGEARRGHLVLIGERDLDRSAIQRLLTGPHDAKTRD